jgi:hypothetical protein
MKNPGALDVTGDALGSDLRQESQDNYLPAVGWTSILVVSIPPPASSGSLANHSLTYGMLLCASKSSFVANTS